LILGQTINKNKETSNNKRKLQESDAKLNTNQINVAKRIASPINSAFGEEEEGKR
jgi:hypothetical protein